MESFSPVTKMTPIPCLLSIIAIQGWYILVGCYNAFLHGILDEKVYMTLLPGFLKKGGPQSLVCKLNKFIYELKQVSRQWFSIFWNVLFSICVNQSKANHTLFTCKQDTSILILLVYVDNVILACNDHNSMTLSRFFLIVNLNLKI